MAVSTTNRLRYRWMMHARQWKWLFGGVPERFAKRVLARWLLGLLYRWLFTAPDGAPHRAGEIVLADLREFCTGTPLFSNDPLVMARRAGRREVFDRIVNFLNLDESQVQKLMELDDGLE